MSSLGCAQGKDVKVAVPEVAGGVVQRRPGASRNRLDHECRGEPYHSVEVGAESMARDRSSPWREANPSLWREMEHQSGQHDDAGRIGVVGGRSHDHVRTVRDVEEPADFRFQAQAQREPIGTGPICAQRKGAEVPGERLLWPELFGKPPA